MSIVFEPVTPNTIETYIQVGTQSYVEHYLHLWENQNPTYLEVSFTPQVVKNEIDDPNCFNFTIKENDGNAGILKISLRQAWGDWRAEEALYLHRLYLLKRATGKNIGKKSLDFVESMATENHKRIIWLEAMKKGKAQHFYQKNGYQIIGESSIDLKGVLAEEKEMWVMGKAL